MSGWINLANADASSTEFIGKKWGDLPKTEYPGFTLPLTWPSEKKMALRYYQPKFGKYVVTITEVVDPKDESKDIILAALDVRNLGNGNPNSNLVVGPTNDCEEIGRSNPSDLVIGMILQKTDKPQKKYKPSKAWKIDSKNLKFEPLKVAKVTCEPKNYSY